MSEREREIEKLNITKVLKIEIPIVGMTCASCVLKVQNNLQKLPGVKNAVVNLVTEKATIEFESDKTLNLKDVIKSVRSIGYDVAIQKITIPIEGLASASASIVENSISKLDGVVSVNINPATENLTVEFVSTLISVDNIKSEIEKFGFKVPHLAEEDVELYEEIIKKREYEDLKKRFIFSSILTSLILLDMLSHFFHHFGDRTVVNYILFLLTTPVMFYGGGKFFRSFLAGIRHLSVDMNTLIAIGTGSAYLYSVVATFIPSVFTSIGRTPDVYYETSAVIITLILLGRLLETRARAQTATAIKKLSSLQPKTATLVKDGEEITVQVKDIKPGDIVLVKPGERIPVDGVIIEGYASVDESVITGESMPVEKKPGDIVIGSTLNKAGSFKFRVTNVGKDTVFSKIIQLVKDSLASKPPIQKLADKVASVFVPIVISIATLSFIVWYLLGYGFTFALMNFIATLIVACPCALGLATPTAIVVAAGKSAEMGILIKNGTSLEVANKVNLVVFDKTGTITYGKPEVTDIIKLGNLTEDEILRLSASVERNSEHPLGEAIVRYARLRNLKLSEPKNFFSIPGQGVFANVDSFEVAVGNLTFMLNLGIDMKKFENTIDILSNEGKTPVFVAVDRKVVGLIAIADTIKYDAKETISKLKKLGIDVALLTGDNYKTARAIANKIGVDKVFAEVLPEQKSEKIDELKKSGYIVAMVGDGINDAPALAKSDVAIAIGSGTEVASATADIILLKDDIKGVLQVIKISSKTYKIIKQNLFWAFFYNIILIPIAAGILYPFTGLLLKPVLASLSMSFSSVLVVTNSLRIKKIKI
ncbi:Cu+-exporting ATPase [Candidatus Thermokryptus mobilis]|uniref:P-type Cu(+) transporter n=1 Tax=Candidatus Thermokryptus mobilis TaxID=1643428 RepID=A0A0S4N3K2_9BACT|nr:heavy metal translocating P-type ATPase [Candidatus Thermokryptus mobilis]CUU05653.1 Cu+-exporting ATPase [Candidatus Thermokryptus mobilis]